jgi:transcriptional regulator with XRE-family HTH domain
MPDAQTPTRNFAANVKRYRMLRGWTQPQLAERCKAAGLDWDRSIIANIEAGRRASVSLQEILALAYVFTVPPVLMIFPLGLVNEVEVPPGRVVETWHATRWFTGEATAVELVDRQPGETVDEVQVRVDAYTAGKAPITLFRAHDLRLEVYELAVDDAAQSPESRHEQQRAQKALRDLRAVRADIRRHGLRPPELPADMKHVDDRRFTYLTPGEAAALRARDIDVAPVDFSDEET